MKAVINDGCIGDGICVDTCPEVFATGDDGLAYVIAETVPAGAEDKAREAADACPVVVIELSE